MMRYRFNTSERNLKKLLSPILTSWDKEWAHFIACTIRDMKMDYRVPPLACDQDLQCLKMPVLVLARIRIFHFRGIL